jgi:hypothetical protein
MNDLETARRRARDGSHARSGGAGKGPGAGSRIGIVELAYASDVGAAGGEPTVVSAGATAVPAQTNGEGLGNEWSPDGTKLVYAIRSEQHVRQPGERLHRNTRRLDLGLRVRLRPGGPLLLRPLYRSSLPRRLWGWGGAA